MIDPARRDFLADRLNAGVNLSQRAKEMGVARATLEALEANPQRRPWPEVAKKVADFYGVKVTDLWPIEQLEQAS